MNNENTTKVGFTLDNPSAAREQPSISSDSPQTDIGQEEVQETMDQMTEQGSFGEVSDDPKENYLQPHILTGNKTKK